MCCLQLGGCLVGAFEFSPAASSLPDSGHSVKGCSASSEVGCTRDADKAKLRVRQTARHTLEEHSTRLSTLYTKLVVTSSFICPYPR